MVFFQTLGLLFSTKNRVLVTALQSRLYSSLEQAAVHHVMLRARCLTPLPLPVSGFSSFYKKKKASFHSTRPAFSSFFFYIAGKMISQDITMTYFMSR